MIIAFKDRKFDKKTVLTLLSLGPTYVIMKFIESQSQNFLFSYCIMIICTISLLSD